MKGIHVAVPALTGLLLGAALYAAPGLSQAQDPSEIVRERQQVMKDNGAAMKTIGGFVEAGVGTLDDVAAAAGTIADAADRIPGLFPEGTSMDEVMDPRSGAKPVIWEQWDAFIARASTLQQEALAMRELALAGDADGVAAQLGTLGNEGCGGCHQTFRQKLE